MNLNLQLPLGALFLAGCCFTPSFCFLYYAKKSLNKSYTVCCTKAFVALPLYTTTVDLKSDS